MRHRCRVTRRLAIDYASAMRVGPDHKESRNAGRCFRRAAAVIFDCDGVLVDSEPLANRVLADLITESGFPLTVDESIRLFVGRTLAGMGDRAFELGGERLRRIVLRDLSPRTLEVFRRELHPMPGVLEVLGALDRPRAVASNSVPERLFTSLRVTGLDRFFHGRAFSSAQVPRPKPAPDIYLLAASQLEIRPSDCVVVEDTLTGCRAALDAGMTVIGFVGGGHAGPDLRQALLAAGSAGVLSDWSDLVDSGGTPR